MFALLGLPLSPTRNLLHTFRVLYQSETTVSGRELGQLPVYCPLPKSRSSLICQSELSKCVETLGLLAAGTTGPVLLLQGRGSAITLYSDPRRCVTLSCSTQQVMMDRAARF